VFMGVFTAYNATGSNNTWIGNNSGYALTTYAFSGNGNTWLGFKTGGSLATPTTIQYSTALGYYAFPWKNYQTVIGSHTTSPTQRADIFGDTRITRAGTVGAEKLANGTFTGSATSWTLGAAWAYNSNNVIKNADGTNTLSQALVDMTTPIVIGESYLITFVISSLTVGTVVGSIGGEQLPSVGKNSTYTFVVTATTTAPLTFTPSNTARFVIDTISLKKLGGSLTVGGDITTAGNIYSTLTAGDIPYVSTNGLLAGQTPVADGTYTVGIGASTNGTITITNGIITAVQEASD